MGETKNKRFWQFPWKFKESFLIVLSLVVIGCILELISNNSELAAPIFPINAVILGAFIVYKIITYRFGGPIIKWFLSKYAAIAAISAFSFLVLLIGLIPQNKFIPFISNIGLTHVKTSWPYLFIVVFLLTTLGYTIIHKLLSQKLTIKNLAFLFNHLGLFIIISGGTIGYSDFYKFKMYLVEGKTIDFAYLNNKAIKMPFSIHLHNFSIEEYQPQLVLVNPNTGDILMKKNQGHWPKVETNASGWLEEKDEWYFIVKKYLPYGISVDSSFIESKKFGAAQAVQVSIANKGLDLGSSGWISCGNYWNKAKVLKINDTLALGMTYPRPKKYKSEVDFIVGEDTVKKNFEIEVNKPLSYKSWKFYQTSYSEKHGRWSDMSVLEVVRDPWLPFVYLGFIMLFIGSLYLLFGKKESLKNN